MSCPDSLLGFAERLAEASGLILRRYFRSGVAVLGSNHIHEGGKRGLAHQRVGVFLEVF